MNFTLAFFESFLVFFGCLYLFGDLKGPDGFSLGLYNTGNMFYMCSVLLANSRFLLISRERSFLMWLANIGSFLLFFGFWFFLSFFKVVLTPLYMSMN